MKSNNSNNSNNPKSYRKVMIKSFSFRLETYNKNISEGTMSLGIGDFGYCPKTKTTTPPKDERKLTDAQILEMFKQTNDTIKEEAKQRKLADAQILEMFKQTNDKIDKLANAGLNPIQLKQVEEIVAKAVEKAIAPLVEEIKEIKDVLKRNNIK